MNNPWAKHFQRPWAEHAEDPRLPDWFRVVSYAYGNHGPNGHTPLTRGTRSGPGTLGLVLARIDKNTGVVKPPRGGNITRAIGTAITLGFLAPGSSLHCLIVPSHMITTGLRGALAPCRVCAPPRR